MKKIRFILALLIILFIIITIGYFIYTAKAVGIWERN